MDFINELENIAKEINQVQSKGLDIDMLQPLIDLGYLAFEEIKQDGQERLIHIERAVRHFRKDYEAQGFLGKRFSFHSFENESNRSYAIELNEVELKFLQSLVSFEGTLSLKQLPSIGTVSLLTRVIHYRLKILGLYGKESFQGVEALFDTTSLKGIREITALLGWTISDLDFINSIGNIEDLIEQIYQHISDNKAFGNKMIYIDKDGVYQPQIYDSKPKQSTLLYFEFLARIFQIRLWVDGLYNGAIDGIIKYYDDKKDKNDFSTQNAIDELIYYLNNDKELRNDPFIVEKEYKLKELKATYFYNKMDNKDNVYFLNVIDLLKITKTMSGGDSVSTASELLIDEDEEKLTKKIFKKDGWFKKDVLFNEDIQEQFKKREEDFFNGSKRRLYYGIRQFGRIAKRVLRNIIKIINLGFNFLRRLAISVYREVKEGLKVFMHGFKFIVGKREILTSRKSALPSESIDVAAASAITKFDLDCDSIVFFDNGIDVDTKKRHQEKCQNQVNSLEVSLSVTALILRWVLILSSGPVSWPSFLLMTARTLKQTKMGAIMNNRETFVNRLQ